MANTSDQHGRYAYANQPLAMQWNLARLGTALAQMLVSPVDTKEVDGSTLSTKDTELMESLQLALASFESCCGAALTHVFGAKLGADAWAGEPLSTQAAFTATQGGEVPTSSTSTSNVLCSLIAVMHRGGLDWTNTWHAVASMTAAPADARAAVRQGTLPPLLLQAVHLAGHTSDSRVAADLLQWCQSWIALPASNKATRPDNVLLGADSK